MPRLSPLPALAAACLALLVPAAAHAAPVNDGFDNATTLSSGSTASAAFDLTGATREVGEPSHAWDPDMGSGTGKAVWFKWTPGASGGTRIQACALLDSTAAADLMDYAVHVYTGGSVSALTPVANWSTYTMCLTRSAELMAVKGTTYRIAVDSTATTLSQTTAAYTLSLHQDTTPPVAQVADPPAVTGPNPKFALQQADAAPADRYRCQVDQGAKQLCSSLVPLGQALAGGPHTLRLWGIDSYNNEATTPTVFSWTVDDAGPAMSVAPPADPAWKTAASVSLTVTPSEPVKNVMCLMYQNKTVVPCWSQAQSSGTFTATFSGIVETAWSGWSTMRATDMYGNVGPDTSFTWQRERVVVAKPPATGTTGTSGASGTSGGTKGGTGASSGGGSGASGGGTAPRGGAGATSGPRPCTVTARAAGRASLRTLRRAGLAVRLRASAPGCRARLALTRAGKTYASVTRTAGRAPATVRVKLPRAAGRAGQKLTLTVTAPGGRVRTGVTLTR